MISLASISENPHSHTESFNSTINPIATENPCNNGIASFSSE